MSLKCHICQLRFQNTFINILAAATTSHHWHAKQILGNKNAVWLKIKSYLPSLDCPNVKLKLSLAVYSSLAIILIYQLFQSPCYLTLTWQSQFSQAGQAKFRLFGNWNESLVYPSLNNIAKLVFLFLTSFHFIIIFRLTFYRIVKAKMVNPTCWTTCDIKWMMASERNLIFYRTPSEMYVWGLTIGS